MDNKSKHKIEYTDSDKNLNSNLLEFSSNTILYSNITPVSYTSHNFLEQNKYLSEFTDEFSRNKVYKNIGLDKKLKVIEDTIEDYKNITDNNINSINTNINVIENDVNTINENIDSIETNIDNYKNATNTNIKDINTNIDTIENDISSYKNSTNNNINRIDTNIENISTNIDTINNNITDINLNIDNIETDIDKYKQTVNNNIQDIKGNIGNIDTEIITINNDIKNVETVINTLDTEEIGIKDNIKISGGPLATSEVQQIFPNGITKDMDLHSVLNKLFCKAYLPKITLPYIKFVKVPNRYVEAGSNLDLTYELSFNPGNYQYGPKNTEAYLNEYTATYNGHIKHSSLGSFGFIQIEDLSYTIEAQASYRKARNIPKNNLGEDVPELIINAGTTATINTTVTGIRYIFAGTLLDKDPLSSNKIRTLTKYNANSKEFLVNVPVGALRVCIAFPDNVSCKIFNKEGFEFTSAFTTGTLEVYGNNNRLPKNYTIYITDFAKAQTNSTIYTIKVNNE